MRGVSNLRIMMLGAPGSGKGTVCKMLTKRFGLPQVSTGDLLRAEMAAGSEIGEEARGYINKGALVPNSVVVGILERALRSHGTGGWLLDGYPRSEEQALALDDMLVRLETPFDTLINLEVPTELIIERISGRLLHPASGRIYHKTFTPPKVEGLDDVTGEPLVRRPDDAPETVLARLKTYEEQSVPVLSHYSEMAPSKVLQVECITSAEAFEAIEPYLVEFANEKNKD